MAVAANNTGIIILGGGVAKHHICNANAFVSIFFFFHLKKGNQSGRYTTGVIGFNFSRGITTVSEPVQEIWGIKKTLNNIFYYYY